MFLLELDSDFQALDTEENTTHVKTCHKCGKGKLKQRAEMRFVHFYQFPIFPLLPNKQTYCNRCHKVFKRERLSKNVFPTWQVAIKFIGLVVLMLLAIDSWTGYQKEKELETSYLLQPESFDVWIINETKLLNESTQSDRFKVAQVVQVTDDKVIVKEGLVLYPSVSNAIKAIRLDQLLIYNYFSTDLSVYDKSELLKLKQQDIIYSAHRPKNLSLFGGIVMRQPMPKPFKRHSPNPLNQEAISLYQVGEYEGAIELFEQAAKQGSAWAQYNLGGIYLEGKGLEVDVEKAQFYFQQAANQGLSKAKQALSELE